MRKVFDWTMLVTCTFGALYCAIQSIRGVPVEPTWAWGIFAYLAASDSAAKRIWPDDAQ